MIICLVGDKNDLSAIYIKWLAEKRNYRILELQEEFFGDTWTYFFTEVDYKKGYLEVSKEVFPFIEIAGVYVRLNPQPPIPDYLNFTPGETNTFILERRVAIQQLLNSAPFVVANRPRTGRANGSKPYQMMMLDIAGFKIPRWVVCNKAEDARNFLKTCRLGAIYKSCSGLRSRVRRVDNQLFEHLDTGTSPVIVQEYIEGHDVRVHVVNRQVFATTIVSQSIDYRFESSGNKYFATSIPDDIKALCFEVSKQEELTIAGLDFRVTSRNEWFCLELNPVPTFLPYEMETGQPIGETLLDLFSKSFNEGFMPTPN